VVYVVHYVNDLWVREFGDVDLVEFYYGVDVGCFFLVMCLFYMVFFCYMGR